MHTNHRIMYRFRMVAILLALAICLTPIASQSSYAAPTAPPASPPVDPSAPWTPFVTSLVSALTVDEKILLVHGSSDPTPLGQAGYLSGIERLGIPPLRLVDAVGINVYKDATAIPTRLGLGASFDREAAVQYGLLEGEEGRALNQDVLLGPMADIARTPNWRRNQTVPGEDPYLSSQLIAIEASAVQSQGLMSQNKHFALYNGQSQNMPSFIEDQATHELYLPIYEAAVKEALVSSLMCSYATFAITPLQSTSAWACENDLLLSTILRDQWGFKGFVTSDWGATHSLSILQGLDMQMPRGTYFDEPLKALADPASPTYDPVYAAALDQSVARILYQEERFGLLDCASPAGPVPGCNLPSRPILDKEAGIATARQLSEKTAVLLKNDDKLLPLKRVDLKQGVAVIGPTSYLLPASPGGERSRGFGDRNMISPLVALQNLAPDANIIFSPGIDRIGSLVPSSALLTPDESQNGLLRTQTLDDVVTTQVDPELNFTVENPLIPGARITWEGSLIVPTDDTYALWLQTSSGRVNEDGTIDPVGGRRPPLPSLSVDGASVQVSSPSTILANTYPGGNTVNGQYLGWVNGGAYLPLTAGSHSIQISYNVPSNAVTPVLFRFNWSPVQATIDAAVEAAKKTRVAIVFTDDANTSGLVPPLGPYQDELVQAVTAANPNTVIVLFTGNPVMMPWLNDVKAVLEMWYPGQEGGTSTANVLLGNANPGGKLSMTFPYDETNTLFYGHPERLEGIDGQIIWTEGLFMGYRWYDQQNVQPLFEFGYGLSYTKFKYSKLSISPASDGGFDVSFRVQNVGNYAGDEVPQVYVGPSPDVPAGIQQAVKKLVQFDRITLDPGHWQDVSLHVMPHELSYWSTADQNWVLGTGLREVFVGASSRDIRLQGLIEVSD